MLNREIEAVLELVSAALAYCDPIDAVYVMWDPTSFNKRLFVYAVVPEHTDAAYDAIVVAIDQIEKKLPYGLIELRVRAHQGRDPKEAVPSDASCLFRRDDG